MIQLEYLKNKLSVIPIREGKKAPAVKWEEFIHRMPTEEEVNLWFSHNQRTGLVCGVVSGNLECIDIDNKFQDITATQNLEEFKDLVNIVNPDLIPKLVIQSTPSGGYHLIYRSSIPILGNDVFASRKNDKGTTSPLFETRSQGGQFLIEPSEGYKIIQGSLTNIQTITEEERQLLFTAARSFNRKDDPAISVNYNTIQDSTNPGTIYNEKTTIEDGLQLLLANRWRIFNQIGDSYRLIRPDKDINEPSATYNFVPKKLFVFSSSAEPFHQDKTYDNFAIFTTLYHNGNFSEAARELVKQGYVVAKKRNGKSVNSTHNKIEKSNKEVTLDGEIVDVETKSKSKKNNIPAQCEFWYEADNGNKNPEPVLRISKVKLINFLQFNGFHKFWIDTNLSIFVRIQQNIISEETTETIIDFIKETVDKLDNQITDNFNKNDLWELVLQKINVYKSKDYLETLPVIHSNFVQDTSKRAYFYFNNCFVKVTPEEAVQLDYDQLNGYIWKEQIINHNIKLLPQETARYTTNCQFGRFLEKVCSPANTEFPLEREKRLIDEDRLSSLCSAIGYLQHTYKDPSVTKAVIFCEEKISVEDDSNGRTGKGLTANALSKTRKRVLFNGKQLDFKDKFLFQKISPDTQLIYFDDVKKNFDFESLFSILTEGITVEKKGQKPIDIPFDRSPKILISTNSVLSNDTDSHKARKLEIEFSDYFSADYTPIDDFGTNFFEKGWETGDAEWDRFYSFMIYCTKHFLDYGIVEYKKANLDERKLKAKLPDEFIEFAEDEYEKLVNGERIYKEELHEKFVGKNKTFGPNGKSAKTQRTTTKWFTLYLDFKEFPYIEERDTNRGERKKYFISKHSNSF